MNSGVWFTSDEHYGHANIIKYCKRPFQTVEEMNAELIRRHNAVVGKYDIVWHLGDFSMHPRELSHMKLLNGQHKLVCGNHDRCHPVHKNWETKTQLYLDAGFCSVTVGPEMIYGPVILHHLPYTGDSHESEERFKDFRPTDHGHWLLHGHVHTSWKVRDRMINVGVDQWDFAPVSLETIQDIIRNNGKD